MEKLTCEVCGQEVSPLEATSYGLGLGAPLELHFHPSCAPVVNGITIDIGQLRRWAQEERANRHAVSEVSPEMLNAGLIALRSRYLDLSAPYLELYPEIVCEVYLAMAAANRQ